MRLLIRTVAFCALVQAIRAQPDAVIRSTTRLVQVQVAVEDSQGRAVAGLRKEDFQILDDGQSRPLASFAVESASAEASMAPSKSTEEGRAGGYSIILLDWLNGGVAERLRAGDALRKVLKTSQPRQMVSLYVLGLEPPNSPHPLRLIRQFSPAAAEIAEAIEDPGILPSPDIVETPGRFDARFGSNQRASTAEEQIYDWNNRIQDTLRALSELADRMAPLRGRKSLIWLTGGFPIAIDGNVVRGAKPAEVLYLSDVNRVIARLNRIGVTVHAIDAAGLAPQRRSYPATLLEFADRTGGVFWSARNDLDEGVRTALDDMRAGYTLGLQVPENARPGLHRIQVRVKKSGVRLRFRESYELGS
jgi:VWFA-related protein